MITGYNTDVDYEGRVYHVQTEDKGRSNPMIESLVYTGGEIITSRRTSYGDLLDEAKLAEADLQKRMEAQHQTLIREIRNGKFDPEGPKPFGYNIISNHSLDEVVLEYLNVDVEVDRIRLEMEDRQTLVEGTRPTVQLRVLAEGSDRPVAGAPVRVKLISTSERPKVVFEGSTDDDGRVRATFEIPTISEANAAVLMQAEAAGHNSEIKQLIRKDETGDSPGG